MNGAQHMRPIAHVYCGFTEKFGIPRQSGLAESTEARIVFEPEYRVREAFRGLEEFSHIWVIWQFHQNIRDHWSPTVRPPLLGGNKRVGVFATRSPFRPNSIGLSCVRLKRVIQDTEESPVLIITGADMMDGTPVYDIKPYLPYVDSKPDAKGGFTEYTVKRSVRVEFDRKAREKIPEDRLVQLTELLEQDPRPAYQDDPDRTYGMKVFGIELKFRVREGVLLVTDIEAADR